MLNRLSRDLNEITVSCEQCSELDTTSTAMMLFNNGYYVVIIIDTSSMMDNSYTLQVTIHPSTAKHSIYYYFSSTFEASVYSSLANYIAT